ncbi:3-hydroxyisobutyrate dehydrogenase [Leptospira hartskeerlii]|uniref:3-hydroxyisobutyrate dehydrogenase n=1 Tax=Leptospira hartskeerlii TaxID=2023177 RepID=A0A2M9XF31_9LEPT|nr:NAD(P)-dependent oxidoreductase [Leptospira hartskeerlii]PJZ26244.1 3-hydroxyisobutyrate dehydrogenase [Leptospira hartskeerlii]PJZ34328.1 3-hydroxyisobutyrate dehydrogenase [Leptospira hartskeerlii]
MSSRKIAIIGTGIMGRGIANNLSSKGHSLQLFARNPEKIQDLKSANISVHGDIKEAAKDSEIIILCLTEDHVVEESVFSSGLLETNAKYVIDVGTTSPSLTIKLKDAFQKQNIQFLDAPMTGSKNAARDGQILFMVGAKSKEEIQDISFVFEICGKNTVYCGQIGDGQKAKIALNMVQAGIFQVYMEGFSLAKSQGIDPSILKSILEQSAAKSGISEFKFPFLFSGNYETHFALKNMYKDLKHALSLGEESGTKLPLCSGLDEIYRSGIEAGLGEKDYCSLNEVTAKIPPAK